MLERFAYTRVLLLFFSFITRRIEEQFEPLKRDLHGARLPVTYHGYLARTMIYVVAGFLTVFTLLVGLTVFIVRTVDVSPDEQVLVVVGLVVPSTAVSYAIYRVRLYYPKYIAAERARAIELSLANVVNFLLALARAGVPANEAIRVISTHADVLGEAAIEFRYAHKDMEYFGADVVDALEHLSESTPLEDLSEFIDGYVRALTGRAETEVFLEEEMRKLFERAEYEQREFLSTLGVLAEVYVAVFVALPIFGLIILLVMGFLGGEVLTGIRVIVYAVIPLSAMGYLILLDISISSPLSGAGRHMELSATDQYDQSLHKVPISEREAPPALEANVRQLERYRFKQKLLQFTRAPLTLMRRQPRYALYVGAILGTAYFLLKTTVGIVLPETPFVAPVPIDGPPMAIVRAVDDVLIEAFVLGSIVFVIFYEIRAGYLADVERMLPEFLDDLSERHQIGMSLSESLRDLGSRDVGRLNVEVERMLLDLRLGSEATDVLRRFANRVRSPVVTRVVVLLTAAAGTAERLEPVIEALADRTSLTQRLNRERRVEMSLYVLIIFIAFFVFLVILAILNDVFLPRIPEGGFAVGGIGSDGFEPGEYETIFYHSAVIQGILGGLVGGKMSEGRIGAGVKYSIVMVAVAYLLFAVVLPNVTIPI